MARRKRTSSTKKRTISPEHLAKMQEGKRKAAEKREKEQRYKERCEDAYKLEKRMRDAQRESEKTVKIPGKRRRYPL